jgi:Fe-S-cluster containining protein
MRVVAEYVPIHHPRFRRAQRSIFTERMVPDCMTHQCRMVDEDNELLLDACCQYGADTDTAERDAILARRDEIGALLRDGAADAPWFEELEEEDPDFPSGKVVRTATFNGGCVFLSHDKRGCAIHRAGLEGGWDLHGVKPHVCRLFPLSYDNEAIVMSDDYPAYSCAYDPGAPTCYRVARPDVEVIFGPELVAALDAAEARVLGEARSLPVIPR